MAQLVKNVPDAGDWVWCLGWEDPLEKGEATHSGILAWRIPWTVLSMGVAKSQTRPSDFHSVPVLYSRTLFIHPVYNRLHLLLPISQSFLSLEPRLGSHKSILYVCESVSILLIHLFVFLFLTFLGASMVAQMVKRLFAVWETQVWSLGQEDPLREGNSIPLQCSCLENSIDRGAWQATVYGVTKSWTWWSDFLLPWVW